MYNFFLIDKLMISIDCLFKLIKGRDMDTNNSSALWMNETLRQYALDNIGINDDQWHA